MKQNNTQDSATPRNSWGGSRGGGRPRGTRQKAVCLRLSAESCDWLDTVTDNKSKYVDQLLHEDKRLKAECDKLTSTNNTKTYV